MRAFRDHFSASSSDYARFRPRYPAALFDWIASASPARGRVWDCATGNGQAAIDLAARFDLVVATDASAAQLAAAEAHDRVRYVRSAAEASGLAGGSMDAICLAQAVHWFDVPAFFREAARAGRRGALLAIWTYGNMSIAPEIDEVVARFYHGDVGRHWPAERRHIENEYRDIRLPFERVSPPELELMTAMTLDDVAGYIGTWSAVHAYRRARGIDPMPALVTALAAAWGERSAARPARWPLTVLGGRL